MIKLSGKLAGTYDAVIVCLGAKMVMLPELTGKLPLRTCRGVVAHFQLHDDIRYLFFMPSMYSPSTKFIIWAMRITSAK